MNVILAFKRNNYISTQKGWGDLLTSLIEISLIFNVGIFKSKDIHTSW